MEKIRIEYDKSWKEVVTHLFNPFVGFFLPDLYEQINWDILPEFLEKELHNAKNIKKSKRIVDKLVKVQLKSGEEQWIFIHIEFQTDGDKAIGLRMYEYYQLIRERYGKEVVALVIYTGNTIPKQPNTYRQKFFGTSITYEFNSFAVIQQEEEKLMNNNNPFALVVLANYYLLKTKGDNEKRYELKEKLYELAKNRDYTIDDFSKLLIFVTELVKLPFLLEQKFEKEVIQSSFKNNSDMVRAGKATKSLINAFEKEFYGETMEEAKANAKAEAKAEAMEEAKAKAEAEAKIIEAELKQLDAQRSKSIILLYTRVNMSINEIAEHLVINKKVVKQILLQHKIIQ
jgi:Putative transposase, YhgA-like